MTIQKWTTFGVASVILLSGGWSQLHPDAPWPSFGKDYQNTRKTNLGAPTNGSIRWQYTAVGRTFGSPVVGPDGTIYYGSTSGVNAVNPNGTLRWRWFNGVSTAWSTPAIGADGAIYIIGNPQDAQLIALNPNGTLRWSLYLGGTDVRSSPAIGPNGKIYVTNGQTPGGYLYCINPDGTVDWRLYLGTEANSIPCFGPDGTIYVGSAYHLNAVNPDGTFRWRYPVYYPVQSTVAFANNRILFGAWDMVFRSITPTGTLGWQVIAGGILESGPAVDDTHVYFASRQGELRRYDVNTGVLRWRASLTTRSSTPAIGSDGTVYLVAWGGNRFFAINPTNGLTRWQFNLSIGSQYTSPAIGADGTVYLVEVSTRLTAFGPLSGFLTGGATLNGWEGGYDGLPVLVEFYQDGELKYEMITTLDENGQFHLEETPVGEHEIKVRVHNSLRGAVSGVHLEEDENPHIRVVLGIGDLNGDNIVDDADLLMVLLAFGEYNFDYDLTGDGYVDDADLMVVLFNFGEVGE
ncbi:MAG: PQQ-binding-like beta-propeller repeat protein [Fimbriimonadales bacterium]